MDVTSEYKSFEQKVKDLLQRNDQAAAVKMIQEHLEKEKNIPLNIAVTGESGSGKSTFLNAFRGIDNKNERAAPTGCDETTVEVTPYPHPNYPNITLWDLPGVGTTKFPADRYLKLVGFEKFDFFIIISATRFKENDVKLAQEIQRMGKKFYFVRSKIDSDLYNAEKSQHVFDKEKTLTRIRENCMQGIKNLGVESPRVFLVSGFDLHLCDFSLLSETIERELPEHQRDALLFAMPNISLEIINKKKKAFKSKIKYYATLSAAVAGVPVPGLSTCVDIALMVGVTTQYIVGFGLDILSLQRLADTAHVQLKDLIDVIVSPLAAKEITFDLIMKLLCQSTVTAVLLVAEEGSRYIPFIGIPAAMSLSFTTTFTGLNMILNMLAEDAHKVFQRALCGGIRV